MEGNQHYGNKQKIVFDICVTRWVKNVDGYEKFYQLYQFYQFYQLYQFYQREVFLEVFAHKKTSRRIMSSFNNNMEVCY